MIAMRTRMTFKEALVSLAAGHALIPLGDNRGAIRGLSAKLRALRSKQAAQRAAAPAAASPQSIPCGRPGAARS